MSPVTALQRKQRRQRTIRSTPGLTIHGIYFYLLSCSGLNIKGGSNRDTQTGHGPQCFYGVTKTKTRYTRSGTRKTTFIVMALYSYCSGLNLQGGSPGTTSLKRTQRTRHTWRYGVHDVCLCVLIALASISRAAPTPNHLPVALQSPFRFS